jgi:YtkA-like
MLFPLCWRHALIALHMAALLGCGGESAPSVPSEPMPLEAESVGMSGTMVITPWPARVGNNALSLTLLDDEGAPLEGAAISVSPWMPAHGHGSRDVVAEEADAGTYETKRLVFNMAGRWQIRVGVDTGEGEQQLLGTIEVP